MEKPLNDHIDTLHKRIDKHMSREEKYMIGILSIFLSFAGIWYYDSQEKDEKITDLKVSVTSIKKDVEYMPIKISEKVITNLKQNWDFYAPERSNNVQNKREKR